MNINSNRSFFCDALTDGWTKKDWALNLIPLGGIACVAYEIGSACFSSKDRVAKISEDFFKAPIQTTIKKIAQCLWVPIVLCGALKLVCLIVKACWNRCFPSASNRPQKESPAIDPVATDPSIIIPPEIFDYIFSYLNLHELGVSRRASKTWNQLASPPILWQSAIYRDFAFSSKNWAEWNKDLVKDVDMRQEMLSLPKDIADELRASAFPGKSIRETHVLVRMPKGLTVNKLAELAKNYFSVKPEAHREIWSRIVSEIGDKSVDESVWLLMTKDVLPESINKSYSEQEGILAKLAETNGVTYQVPTALEAATCMLAEYFLSKNRPLCNSRWTYTCCQDKAGIYRMFVGSFPPSARLIVLLDSDVNDFSGVAALRKF